MSIKKVIFTSYTCDKSDSILQKILTKWEKLNPEYEVKYFSDDDVDSFFKDTEYYSTFSKMRNGVTIADFFRICYINKYGGYWFDLDVEPTQLNLPDQGSIHLFDAGFGNISYMFIGGAPKQKIFHQVICKVVENIERNTPIKVDHVIDITGPRVIQNIICSILGIQNRDGWLPGDEHPRVGLQGTENEFIYTRIPFKELKTSQYQELQKKYKRKNYQAYNYI